mgnify:CR=1 FL=1
MFQFSHDVVWSEISGVIVLGHFSKEYVKDLWEDLLDTFETLQSFFNSKLMDQRSLNLIVTLNRHK